MFAALGKLATVDRRWLYVATLLVLLIPFVCEFPNPATNVAPATRMAFDVIGNCAPDKVVFVDSSWDSGSASENRAEFEAVLRHLCRQRIKFVIASIGITPFGPEFAQRYGEPILKEAGYVYGQDWVNLGYIAGPPVGTRGLGAIIEKICRDVHGAFPSDYFGTPVAELPLMARVRTHADIDSFGVFTYGANEDWMSVIPGIFRGRLWVGCMSIASPAFYPYLDSGQVTGMIAGNRGAAEYELLLGRPGLATKLAIAAAFGNCAIIATALLGNVAAWAARRSRRGVR